jgi:hypothetical protein
MVVAPQAAADEPPAPVAPGVPGQGRAWELLTAPEPVTVPVLRVMGMAVGGDRVFYETIGQMPGSPVFEPLLGISVTTRGTAGWTTAPIGPSPLRKPVDDPWAQIQAADPAFETTIWTDGLPSDAYGLFRRSPDGEYVLLAELAEKSAFLGASADVQHVVFASEKHLLAADAARTSGTSLYEYVGSELRLVDVGDDGTPLSACGSRGGGLNSISRDGRRIFFSAEPACVEGPRDVYLRADGAETTEISASQCDLPDCGPADSAFFAGATPSGSDAFLITAERLTDDDSNSHADLYRYHVPSGELTLISTVAGGPDLAVRAEAVRPSVEGSRVYFAADALPEGEGTAGRVYLADEGAVELIPGAAAEAVVQTSADGRYAAYATNVQVTVTDTDANADVYRYDAANGSATLISGGDGAFDASVTVNSIAGLLPASHPYRFISQDGSRIFFTTPERLLPSDQNDVGDVYEWASGSLSLLSGGVGKFASAYATSTPDGSTAVFSSAAPLVSSDRDNGDWDFYAARIGGGFPQPAAPPDCGAACLPPQAGPLDRPLPASAAVSPQAIRLGRVGAAQRRRIVATGWISVLAEVPAAGMLSAVASARIGDRQRTVASRRLSLEQAGPVRVRMRLSKPARARLAQGRRLRVRLRLRLSDLPASGRVGFVLRGAR